LKRKPSSRLKELVRRASTGFYASLLMSKMEQGLRTRWNARQRARDLNSPAPLHVSDLMGNEFCLRQTWYKLNEAKRPYELHSYKKLMTWFDGDSGEAQLKRLFDIAKVPVASESELKQKKLVGRISGTPDDIRLFMSKLWIIECKTLYAAAWRRLVEPTRQYLQQVISYMMLYEIPRGIIAVKGKDVSEWKFFEVRLKRHMDVAREMADRIRRAVGLDNTIVPHRYCKKPSDRKAKTCPFRDVCFVRDAAKP